jgi:phytoene dehydrogenase-like protein
MANVDYVVVGGGINGLVAAAILGKKGRKVLVLERNDRIGGCLRSEEITAPGFVHDVMATTLVLFITSPAYAAIGKDLEARGFAVAHSDLSTGVIRPDGSHVLFSRDRARNVAAFEACAKGDGETFASEMDRMGARTRPFSSLCSAASYGRGRWR